MFKCYFCYGVLLSFSSYVWVLFRLVLHSIRYCVVPSPLLGHDYISSSLRSCFQVVLHQVCILWQKGLLTNLSRIFVALMSCPWFVFFFFFFFLSQLSPEKENEQEEWAVGVCFSHFMCFFFLLSCSRLFDA
jgi:hypothetical protein